MTAVHILATARAAGVRVRVDGDDLIVKAASADVIELLKQHNSEVIALLRLVEPLRAELGRILEAGPLPDMPLRRWEQFQIDAANFLRDWADTAIALGWMVDDVFGCDARHHGTGLTGSASFGFSTVIVSPAWTKSPRTSCATVARS